MFIAKHGTVTINEDGTIEASGFVFYGGQRGVREAQQIVGAWAIEKIRAAIGVDTAEDDDEFSDEMRIS